MPELRLDPVTGRPTYVAEERAGRPNDFDASAQRACPFCAGHEAQTPQESAAIYDADGRWQVRVVPNKYPIVGEAGGDAAGAHEVVIESPRHVRELTELTPAELTQALTLSRDRLRHWRDDGRFLHATLFKNSGAAAGASLAHVHSQLIALPTVPPVVEAELAGAAARYAASGRCVYCDLLADPSRQVFAADGYVAFCPPASRQPYETWLLPQRHASQFEELSDAALPRLAAAVGRLVSALAAVAPGAAYNLLLHSGPFRGDHRASFHWHWELVPRLTQLAGFEWGAGAYVNPLAPERAAATLRTAWLGGNGPLTRAAALDGRGRDAKEPIP